MVTKYVISSKNVFNSDLIFADENLYACRELETKTNSGILKDKFSHDSIPLKTVVLKTPTKSKDLNDIFNAEHNRFVLHSFLMANSGSLRWTENKCRQQVIILNTDTNNLLNLTNDYNIYLSRAGAKQACLKLLMLHHLKHHVYARLTKSEHGVGVKAIKYIPAGTPIFDTMLTKCASYRPVSITDENAGKISDALKELLGDFYLQSGKKISYPIPMYGPNTIDPSFYLNHSKTPNLSIKYLDDCDMSIYVANKPIAKDEDLSINYCQFNFSEREIKERMPFLTDCSEDNSTKKRPLKN